ncbi:MAG: MepB family protein [Pseudomonadota bacterium]
MATDGLPDELVVAIRDTYLPAGMTVTDAAVCERESAEYGACRFGLDGKAIVFRVAKTTPTKIGQFVTLWKRPSPGDPIAPLDISDDVDLIVVSVSDETQRGQFVFDRAVLAAKDIMSAGGQGGKRAIRVYPPWTRPIAKLAMQTQQWQLRYFFSIPQDGAADSVQLCKLFHGDGLDKHRVPSRAVEATNPRRLLTPD